MDPQKLLEIALANLPILIGVAAGLGVLGFLAAKIRRAVVKARAHAKATPNKIDDVLVDLLDGPALEIADLIERGDITSAKAKARALVAAVERAKAGLPQPMLPKIKADPR
jgi:Flp pilus assembly protein CpaB